MIIFYFHLNPNSTLDAYSKFRIVDTWVICEPLLTGSSDFCELLEICEP